MNRFILLVSLIFCSATAHASPLIADLSLYTIDIDSNFSGTRLYVFGVRNGSGDIVAVLRGQNANYIIRKKEKIAGFWFNTGRYRLNDVPMLYALASSMDLSGNDGENNLPFSQLGIGMEQVLPAALLTTDHDYLSAFLRNQQRAQLYKEQQSTVKFLGETLFKAALELPDNVPPGDYTAEVYLVSEGEIVGMQSTPVRVRKTGLDAALADMAHSAPALYGLLAIAIALAAGWLAGRVFEKI